MKMRYFICFLVSIDIYNKDECVVPTILDNLNAIMTSIYTQNA